MARPRVNEIARELGLTSKEVLTHLEEIGHPVKSHSSAVDEDIAARLRTDMGGASAAEPEVQTPAPAAAEPEPREAVAVVPEPQGVPEPQVVPEPKKVVAVEPERPKDIVPPQEASPQAARPWPSIAASPCRTSPPPWGAPRPRCSAS